MELSIHFVTKSGEFIHSLYKENKPQDVFKVGDKLYFDFEEIYPNTREKMRKEMPSIADDIMSEHDEKKRNYGYERYKIISKYISLNKTYNLKDNYSLIIEYTVKKCPKFYFKWWYIKYLIKNIFKIKKHV